MSFLVKRENRVLRQLTAIALATAVIGVLPAHVARGQEGGEASWEFTPPVDRFERDVELDLRSLNEKIAGESGYVRRTADGRDFLLGNGQPVRFWGLNTGVAEQVKDDQQLAEHARFIAKRGVNMVRFHGGLAPKEEGSKITDVNEEHIDACWRMVAAMKKEGIYTTISPYWAIPVKVKESWGVDSAENDNATGLLFFDKKMQEGYKAWLKALLSQPNKYTGIPLAKDPAVAIIQLQNEDSLLFWTFLTIKGKQRENLGRLFAKFVAEKHGSLDQAMGVWQTEAEGDAISEGVLGFLGFWEYGSPQQGGKGARMADQLQFLTETMTAFNREMATYIRKDLGCNALINAGNWITANAVTLNDAERYSYTVNDVIAVNKYFNGIHKGKHEGWAIGNGDLFTNESALLNPRPLPTNLKQPAGHPIIISESAWVPPNAYQSEGPFLMNAYQSLTGVDTFYWFATGDVQWTQPKSANGYVPDIGKWVTGDPMQMGQFPANALAYRKQYVKRAEPVVTEERALEDLWRARVPIIAEAATFDPNRNAGDMALQTNIKGGIDPLAFLVGPVEVKYGGNASRSKTLDLTKYIDRDTSIIRAVTGELSLDFRQGVCTMNAPKAQGVSGFLAKAGGNFKLQDVTIESDNEYASVVVVPLDDQPLSTSGKVLIQIGTTARPTGWKDEPANIEVEVEGEKKTVPGRRVVAHGGAPWVIANTQLTLTLRS
ncbi:MAG TPA: hypothetical protein VGB55_10245, partial [Tepidisphaeraceae bacterium]